MKRLVPIVALLVILTTFIACQCNAFQSLPVPMSCRSRTDLQSLTFKTPFTTKLASKMEFPGDESEQPAVEDDDGGWGASSADGFEEKTKELRALQNSRQTTPPSRTQAAPEGERDLFIPIFAVVSLLGLVGSYGYEMMRLASRGELYLPWNN